MQKTCTRCQTAKPQSEFVRRAASPDGYAAACKACQRTAKQEAYFMDAAHRVATLTRVKRNRETRFAAQPGYRRAFDLWGSTKKRKTKIPPWVVMADFISVCQVAELLGDSFQIDHVVPLIHPLVCGLHVPGNVRVLPAEINRLRRCSVLTFEEINAL